MCEHGKTVDLKFSDRVWSVDACIAPLVQALNQGGIATVASCCGHGKINGLVSLRDGRELIIMSTDQRRLHFEQSPHTIHGEARKEGYDVPRMS